MPDGFETPPPDPYRLLDQRFIRDRISHVGMFVLAYETLKSYIVESAQSFFADDYRFENGKVRYNTSDAYKINVLSLGNNPFIANLRWLANNEILSDKDLETFAQQKNYRDNIIHNPSTIFGKDDEAFNSKAIDQLSHFHRIISNFWGRIEAGTQDAIDHAEIDHSGIRSSLSYLLDYMVAALQDEPTTNVSKNAP